MSDVTTGARHVGIVELGTICAQHAARSRRAFEVVGRWVTNETDPARQRLWSTAAHRHAWHAELWAARLPAIPPLDGLLAAATTAPADALARPDAESYRRDLADDRAALAALRARIDPDLDPSTLRVVALVDADLDELASRLA